MSQDQESILEQIESIQKGTRNKIEAKLKKENATLVDLLQVNENIKIGSPLYLKGPLYWNAITIEKDGEQKRYRIIEYLQSK